MRFFFLLLIFFAFARPVGAGPTLPSSDIQTVIEAQLKAFSLGDAEAAFKAVSFEVKTIYKTASSFMNMVLNNYTPLFFAKKWRFDQLFLVSEGSVQVLYVNDPMGNDWVAWYKMVKGQNGTWKIDNVSMALIEGVLT